MAQQKAKLDILDLPLDKSLLMEDLPPPPPGDAGDGNVPEKQKRAWFRDRRVLAGGIGVAVLGILAAAVLLIWNPMARNKTPGTAVPVTVRIPAGASEAAALVEEFYVDIKDASGTPRLAVVNIALDPVDRKVLPEMNGLDVRREVHAILSAKTAEVLRTPRERENIRKEITGAINQVLKREAVKTVWFSDLNVW
ncbi:MAG: hypothetical protein HPY65_09670 [Syntrophaceae bacterium]|nr:hypothetical protein [Syntrophaceae bacterium]